jgi:hypothetical protein
MCDCDYVARSTKHPNEVEMKQNTLTKPLARASGCVFGITPASVTGENTMKKLVVLLAVLGATATGYWLWLRPAAISPATANSSSRISTLRVGLEARYRLRPDARFLLAMSEIHRILLGGATNDKPAQAEFRAGRWTIRHGNREAGTISDPPDFAESIQFLSAWAGLTIKEKSIQFATQSARST